MSHRTQWLLAGLILVPLRIVGAQGSNVVTPSRSTAKPVADSQRCGFCPHHSIPSAILSGFRGDVLVNRFNAWIRKDSTAYVGPKTWKLNLQRGWDWDNDDFLVNMLGHPYSGAGYYAGARNSGHSFWVGVPFTFVHSVVWEYFGETTQPSVNDLVNTGFGGVALGEMFHRVAETIRDNTLSGGRRLLREVLAIPFDPGGSFNRLMAGQWSRRAPNPLEHNPRGSVLRMGGGVGIVRAPGSAGTILQDPKFSSILFADMKYGDAFVDSMRRPFDAFSMRMALAPGHGGLTQLVGVGRITGKNISHNSLHPRHLELNQRFEYVNNGALQFGAQTIQFGLSSRRKVVDKFWVRTMIAADGILLAGINAPGAGTGPRTYDFGPGIGATLAADFEIDQVPYFSVQFQPAYTHTISGANANHRTSFSSLELAIPVMDRLSLVIQGNYYTRLSLYGDGSRNQAAFPELRLFAAYKRAHRVEAQ